MLDKIKAKAIEEVKKNKNILFDLSKKLYENPETNYLEKFAVETFRSILKEINFKSNIGKVKTSFISKLNNGKKTKPKIAIIAEYDALPEMGHGCGHNLISAMSLGAFLALKPLIKNLNGEILLIGTPAEEGGGGKIEMVKAGVFDKIDAAIMIHPGTETTPGKEFLALSEFQLDFFGKSAHAAAAPDLGINALDACIQTFNNVNALRQHLTPDVKIHGIITNGGVKPNIVPDLAQAVFYVRCADQKYLPLLEKRFLDCAKSAAIAMSAKVKIKKINGYQAMKRISLLEDTFKKNIGSLGVKCDKEEMLKRLGSSDIGDLSQKTPCLHAFLKVADIPLHSVDFAKETQSKNGKNAIVLGAKALAMTVIDLLDKKGLLEEIKKEFKKR